MNSDIVLLGYGEVGKTLAYGLKPLAKPQCAELIDAAGGHHV